MNTTQKKLKKKHFRYLGKKEIANPMVYIDEFFGSETDLKSWKTDISIFVDAAYTSKNRISGFEYGFTYKRIIGQIEVAYTIYCLPGFERRTSERKVKSSKDIRHAIDNLYVIDPEKTIARFFVYRRLEQWREIVDDMLSQVATHDFIYPIDQYDNILEIKELLLELAEALHIIYEQEGIELNPHPLFFIRENKDTDPEANNDVQEEIKTDDTRSFYPEKKIHLPERLKNHTHDIAALRSFFLNCSLAEWKEQLWKWLHVVTIEGLVWSKPVTSSNGSELLYSYHYCISFIDIVFEITESPEGNGKTAPKQEAMGPIKHHEHIDALCRGRKVSFKHISIAEARQPTLILQEFVAAFSCRQWEDILYDWLEYGLSEEAYIHTRYADSSLYIYHLLNRMLEACFLIAFKDEITFEPTEQLP